MLPVATAAVASYDGTFGEWTEVTPTLQASGGADEAGKRNPLVSLCLNAHPNRLDAEAGCAGRRQKR